MFIVVVVSLFFYFWVHIRQSESLGFTNFNVVSLESVTNLRP